MTGQQLLSIVVVGSSGNRSKVGVRVARGESDIPSFSVSAGNGTATLRWDAQAGRIRYDILYAEDRTVGDGTGAIVVEDVTSPHVIRGLANGSRYVFRIKAAEAGGPDAWSSEQDAVPLGSSTLKPEALGEYGGVRLSWASVPGVRSCEVWRSARREDGWAMVASGQTGTSWFDDRRRQGWPGFTASVRRSPVRSPATRRPRRPSSSPTGRSSRQARSCSPAPVRSRCRGLCVGMLRARRHHGWSTLATRTSPREVASVALPDARAIAVAGTVACVADGERGIVLLDVSDPRAPRETGVRYLQDPQSVALSSDIAYVACGAGGVRLIDVSDPRSPERLGVLASPDARALCLWAGQLLVADAVAGLRVFDLASPAAPRLIAELALAGAQGITAGGERAIVLAARSYSIIDLTDPARPVALARVVQAVSWAALAEDGYAVVSSGSGVAVLDTVRPTGTPIDIVPASHVESMALAGDLACVLEAESLRLLRMRVLGRPAVVGGAATAGNAGRIALEGNRAFIAARSSGLLVFDVSEETSRRTFGSAIAFNARFAEDVAADGSLAFVADGAAGLRIVAVEPDGSGAAEYRARELSLFQPGGVVHAVSVSKPLACIAAGAAGVLVLDVSDPTAPRQLAAIPSPDAQDVALEGTLLLVADAEAGLRSFDLTIPTDPSETAPPLAPAFRVSMGEGRALAVSGAGVAVVDCTEGRSPRVVGFYRTAWAEDACRDGDRALVAEGHRGLTVLDLSDPARLRIVSARRDLYASAVSAGEGCVLVAGAGSVTAMKILVPPWLER